VIIEWAVIVVVAVLASLLVRTFVFQTYFIPSASMEPTLMIGDRIIVNKLSVDFGTIHTGDIVVFKAPPAENCGTPVTDLVKRVIGVPGDTLTSKGNTIYIDGKALKETWSHYEPFGRPIGHVYVKPGQYFVMGDNSSRLLRQSISGVPCRVRTSSARSFCASGRFQANRFPLGIDWLSPPTMGPCSSLSPIKIMVIVAVALLLLGPDKLPDVAHKLGSSWRALKRLQEKVETEVREAIPDLPSTSDIVRIARSPVNYAQSAGRPGRRS
jgi:signal peptidase I